MGRWSLLLSMVIVISFVFAISCVSKEVAAPSALSEPPASPATTLEAKPTAPSFSLPYNDDFSNPNSGWCKSLECCSYDSCSSESGGKFAYEDGEFSILIERMNWCNWQRNSVIGMQEDFTVEVDARKLSIGTCVCGDCAGIVFRDQIGQDKDSFYVFWVDSDSGTYAIEKFIKGLWTPLTDWTYSDYIDRVTNTNRLKVVCNDSKIEVYVNNYKLNTVTDTSLTNGFIALAVQTCDRRNAHYHFDNFKLNNND